MLSHEHFLSYDSKTIVSTRAGSVSLPRMVNGLTVRNTGNTNLFWDSDLIVPGDFKAVSGNYGEIYRGTCTLKWELPAVVPANPENMATVSVKFYVEYNP
jgi:hypothetical protein